MIEKSELLEVSVDSILSAGKISKPAPVRMTNYSVAFSKNKKVWKEYIDKPEKPILNEDEYGKTVIDYAIEFKNYGFLKYLIDKGYIYFIDEDQKNYWQSFGAGTRIKRREPFKRDLLEGLKAREIPDFYNASYYPNKELDFGKYYDSQMMNNILAAPDKVLAYFSEEFEIKTNRDALCKFTFPYLGELIERAVDAERNIVIEMLENALKHNQEILISVKNIAQSIWKRIDSGRQEYEPMTLEAVMHDFWYDAKNDTVCYSSSRYFKGNFQGVFSNVVCVKVSSEDEHIQSLIEEVNYSYDQIKNFRYERE